MIRGAEKHPSPPANMAQPATSAITMGLTSPSHSAVMSKPTAFSNLSAAVAKHGAGMPLTPPNSVSPGLPAAAQAGLRSPPPIQIDGENTRPSHPLSKGALSGLDASQSITASMLAKNHLPGIMLGHGPVAIRHVMACLTQSVPGFSRIPPAKARRLVVAGLENKMGGGVDGSVVFEKVGWGRWDAHLKGERPEFGSSYKDGKLSPPPSEPESYAASYTGSAFGGPGSYKPRDGPQLNSWTESSMMSHYDEHLDNMSMEENEADKMSLDGSSAVSDDDSLISDSEGDETEEEDWAAIGPDALRKASVSTAASFGVRRNYNLISIPGSLHEARTPSIYGSAGGARSSFLTKATPQFSRRPSAMSYSQQRSSISQAPPIHGNTAMDIDQTSQEREAIEALLRMGSA